MRVLHLPTAVGGMSWGLAQGEKKLGLESQVLLATSNRFGYPGDICLDLDKRKRMSRYYTLLKTFLDHRSLHDVFHFNFGSSLIDFPGYGLHLLDLPWYPSRSSMVVTYNGCDARLKYATMGRVPISACHEEMCYGGICNDGRQDQQKKLRIGKFARYAAHMFAVNPDLLWNLPPEKSSFLPYAVASWDNAESRSPSQAGKLKIVHAPTNREVKGSKYILAALDQITRRYRHVTVDLIEGLSNYEAVKAFGNADIVVDQVLVGWYGGLAVEAMQRGTPVASFVREEDLVHVPPAMAKELKEAMILITPDNIEERLSQFVENPLMLADISTAALEYVKRWHSPEHVAGITKTIYESVYSG